MELLEVLRGDREGDGFTDRLLKGDIGAVAEDRRKLDI
jgi:hypothetical protein